MSRQSALTSTPSRLTRRGFLIAMSAAGAAFGFPRLSGAEAVLAASGDGGTASGHVFEPSLWYQVDSDGKVNINITRAEMGQHIGT